MRLLCTGFGACEVFYPKNVTAETRTCDLSDQTQKGRAAAAARLVQFTGLLSCVSWRRAGRRESHPPAPRHQIRQRMNALLRQDSARHRAMAGLGSTPVRTRTGLAHTGTGAGFAHAGAMTGLTHAGAEAGATHIRAMAGARHPETGARTGLGSAPVRTGTGLGSAPVRTGTGLAHTGAMVAEDIGLSDLGGRGDAEFKALGAEGKSREERQDHEEFFHGCTECLLLKRQGMIPLLNKSYLLAM